METDDIDKLKCFTMEHFKFNFLKGVGINVNCLQTRGSLNSFFIDKMESYSMDDDRNIIESTMNDFNECSILSNEEFKCSLDIKNKFDFFLKKNTNIYALDGILNEEEERIVAAISNSFDSLMSLKLDFGDGKYRFDLHTEQFLIDDLDNLFCCDLILEL